MSAPQNFPGGNIYSFLPAILKENKSGWILEYYAEHPVTHELTRKQIRLQKILKRYKSVKDARAHIARMITKLNAQLAGGWNPFFSQDDARLYERFDTVTDLFLREKKKENRENTYRSYESFCKLLNEYISKNSPDILFSLFNRLQAVYYMDYVYNVRNVGAYTYNNHLKMGRALFNWAKEKCYTKENPFDYIKPKEKPRKTRVIIPPDVREKIIQDLQIHSPELLLIAKLVYNSLIRPQELKLLKIQDIKPDKHYIVISDKIAKNKKTRLATINADIISDLTRLNVFAAPEHYFLFSENLKPGTKLLTGGYFSKRWDKMRKRLGLPIEMQLYSLRDTGIHEMLKSGIDDLSVMQHADHASLEMTTLYGNHYDPALIDTIYKNSPQF